MLGPAVLLEGPGVAAGVLCRKALVLWVAVGLSSCPPSSGDILVTQLPPGLLFARVHNSVDKSIDNHYCAVLRARPQLLDHSLPVQPDKIK